MRYRALTSVLVLLLVGACSAGRSGPAQSPPNSASAAGPCDKIQNATDAKACRIFLERKRRLQRAHRQEALARLAAKTNAVRRAERHMSIAAWEREQVDKLQGGKPGGPKFLIREPQRLSKLVQFESDKLFVLQVTSGTISLQHETVNKILEEGGSCRTTLDFEIGPSQTGRSSPVVEINYIPNIMSRSVPPDACFERAERSKGPAKVPEPSPLPETRDEPVFIEEPG